eukprot:CAMPEP_0180615378 /NCGR_PEP_ID=MMETSP1037_2-20121125/31913_1 /TAXON_ID=632150 /ORGANISM="Azadinium spinosum, Strain 3D9" /LENGTH=573 /DNA_ID=CAMNT_0022635143 /DNA_START=1 /DNA_END=1722 /DNA_ORIENTATION=+
MRSLLKPLHHESLAEPIAPAQTHQDARLTVLKKPELTSNPLFAATQTGDVPEVMRLLQTRVDPNVGDALGETPLFEAVANDKADLVAALLLNGADPLKQSEDGTVIPYDGITTLLDLFQGAKVPLDMRLKALSALSLSVRESDFSEMSPSVNSVKLMDERESGRIDALVAERHQQNHGKQNNAAEVHWMSRVGKSQNDIEVVTLLGATQNDDVFEVQRLLQERADPNSGSTVDDMPLFQAVKRGNSDIVASLLLHSANPNKRSDDSSVVSQFASDGNIAALLEAFQDAGGKIGLRQQIKLMNMINPSMRPLAMKLLRKASADASSHVVDTEVPSAQPRRDESKASITRAPVEGVRKDEADQVDADAPLLATTDRHDMPEFRKDPGGTNKQLPGVMKSDAVQSESQAELVGRIPPAEGVSKQHAIAPMSAETITIVAENATEDLPDLRSTATPLLVATQSRDLSEVQRLLEERADPNVGNAVGEIPLFEAVTSGNADLIASLLLHSADPCKQSDNGSVASQLAPNTVAATLLELFQGTKVRRDLRREALTAITSPLRQLAQMRSDTLLRQGSSA